MIAMAKILLGCPLYDDRLGAGPSKALWRMSSQRHEVREVVPCRSLIDTNCSEIWCIALNNRGLVSHVAMLHSDITPEDFWIDKLMDEADQHGADLISAVSPVKDERGLYSTAIAMPGGKRHFRRLTVQQVNHPAFPTSFGIREAADALESLPGPLRIADVPRDFLFVNTGCMVCRVDCDWAERVWFSSETVIECVNGMWQPYTLPEDWLFSRRVAEQGGRVMATKAVKLTHRGWFDWPNTGEWGQPRDTFQP
jgi:hypothetical protein